MIIAPENLESDNLHPQTPPDGKWLLVVSFWAKDLFSPSRLCEPSLLVSEIGDIDVGGCSGLRNHVSKSIDFAIIAPVILITDRQI